MLFRCVFPSSHLKLLPKIAKVGPPSACVSIRSSVLSLGGDPIHYTNSEMAGNGIGQIMAQDPYLAYQPSFAYTLPVQLVVSGITLTLLCVLLIHIVCTFQRLSNSSVSHLAARLTSFSHHPIPLSPCSSELQPAAVVRHRRYHFRPHEDNHDAAVLLQQGGLLAV